MTAAIELRAGAARATVLPGMGAALAGLWVNERPVLRPWSGRQDDGPFAVAGIVLAPVSNRVSRPFDWRGERFALPRNLAAEAFPIHGDAFQKPWAVTGQGPAEVALSLADGAFGPLSYRARMTLALAPAALACRLEVTSRCPAPMPFGAGFHPWFPRGPDTRLGFAATGVWPEDERHLPATPHAVGVPPPWDFAAPRALPAGWINNGFAGWDGRLTILQGPAATPLTLTASPELGTLVVFSPGAAADFFCAEPVSHPVDALNLPGRPGLAVLAPGETLSVWMRLAWAA